MPQIYASLSITKIFYLGGIDPKTTDNCNPWSPNNKRNKISHYFVLWARLTWLVIFFYNNFILFKDIATYFRFIKPWFHEILLELFISQGSSVWYWKVIKRSIKCREAFEAFFVSYKLKIIFLLKNFYYSFLVYLKVRTF